MNEAASDDEKTKTRAVAHEAETGTETEKRIDRGTEIVIAIAIAIERNIEIAIEIEVGIANRKSHRHETTGTVHAAAKGRRARVCHALRPLPWATVRFSMAHQPHKPWDTVDARLTCVDLVCSRGRAAFAPASPTSFLSFQSKILEADLANWPIVNAALAWHPYAHSAPLRA